MKTKRYNNGVNGSKEESMSKYQSRNYDLPNRLLFLMVEWLVFSSHK